MRLFTVLVILALAAYSVIASPVAIQNTGDDHVTIPEAARKVLGLAGTLKSDPTGAGIKHIGDDGVMRSYAGNGTVLDALPLTNEQLMAIVNNLPSSWSVTVQYTFHSLLADAARQPHADHLHDIFDSTDGFSANTSHHLTPPDTIKIANWPPENAVSPRTFPGPRTNPGWDVSTVPLLPPCYDLQCIGDSYCYQFLCGDCVAIDFIVPYAGRPGVCATYPTSD